MTTVAVIGDSQAQGIVHYGNLPDQLVAQGLQYVGGYQLPGASTREIATNVQQVGNEKFIYYKLTMNLTNLETSTIDCTEEKQVRKFFKKRNVGL